MDEGPDDRDIPLPVEEPPADLNPEYLDNQEISASTNPSVIAPKVKPVVVAQSKTSVREDISSTKNVGTFNLPELAPVWEAWKEVLCQKSPLMSVPWCEADVLWVPPSEDQGAILCILFKQFVAYELVQSQPQIFNDFKLFLKERPDFNFPFHVKAECPVPPAQDLSTEELEPTPEVSQNPIPMLSEEELLAKEPLLHDLMQRFGGRLLNWREAKN